jgi:hypothetical protein
VVNNTLAAITFEGNENLEEVYVAKYAAAQDLDLTESPGLLIIDARGSGFSTITLPENAPTHTVQLNAPKTLVMSKLTNLETLTIANYNRLEDIQIEDIDRSPNANSKILVDRATNLARYKLRNVIWSIADIEELNTNNNSIAILEKLLTMTPSADVTG